MKTTRVKGASTMDLLIWVVVASVIALMIVTNFDSTVSSTKAMEAKNQLNHLHALEKTYYYINSKYSTDLDEIGYEHAKLTTEGGNANYQIEIISASPSGFVARATAVVDFDNDGAINVWEVDQDKNIKEITKD